MSKKSFKDFLADKGITEAQAASMDNNQAVKNLGEYQEHIAVQIAKDADENAGKRFDELKSAMDQAQKDQNKALEEMGLRVKAAVEVGGQFGAETVEAATRKFMEENKEEIRKVYNQKQGFFDIEIKAVANVTTGSATAPTAAPGLLGAIIAPPSNANLRIPSILDLCTVIDTTSAVYAYTETLPKEGDAAFTAEGALKSQLDHRFETRYVQPKKVTAYEVLTEESISDIAQMQSIATNLLRSKHDLKKEYGVLFGDGTGANPIGATVYGRAFAAGTMALTIPTPNFMDAIAAMKTDVENTHNFVDEVMYSPNVVLVSPTDFYIQIYSAKNTLGEYLFQMAAQTGQMQLGNTIVKQHRSIPAGRALVADMSKYNITNYLAYNVRIGWVNDDMIKNQFTLVGESRFHAFVKELDKKAFVYDQLATVKQAITKA